ncbi:DUF975 family protein [Pseudoflavonifractor sp. 524-17]|uniref:DUF975 family protein n=1 Tax=Pseudoflavonifractor sp. 524-17 TaxID=2304577 RepID=UPI0013795FA4|nr:DUF975 family protein [Pseudoflavonifractor sp. 524-17]
MDFNRAALKADARAAIGTAKPHPMMVTLVFRLATAGLTVLVMFIALASGSGTLTDALAGAALGLGFYPEGLLTRGQLLIMIFLNLVMGLFSAVMGVGYTAYGMHLARRERADYQDLIDSFGITGRILRTMLLTFVLVVLWLIPYGVMMTAVLAVTIQRLDFYGLMAVYFLLVLGMIVYGYLIELRYAMTYFFLLDEPEMGVREAVRSSVQVMRGWKWTYCKLQLSFLGWALLSCMTMGVLGLWLSPYEAATYTNFYDFITSRRSTARIRPEW